MDIHGETNKGLTRKRNEDRFIVRALENNMYLLAVADGMGGEAAGDIAAQILVDVLSRMPSNPNVAAMALSNAFKEANTEVINKANNDTATLGMGTTATAIILNKGEVTYSHVGDSRLYHYHNGHIIKITEDHTLVQRLVDGGVVDITESRKHPLRHILEQCIGCDDFSIDTGVFYVQPDDVLLLCSDGLTNELDDRIIETILGENEDASSMASNLIAQALLYGGRDNVTAIVAIA
ncbi:PP2C family protein-serine/threonine phosphatase [Fundidesulfovibrio putealis]|uniref:PP2C family protein-serine/threonine phosphatase n=1 Tax=Fundidesulfovibrio putealis TaxID=270496 RepID=UPI000A054700|nr:protein phosphatase 2C domain-containing protein [Fundidesulfovibrio putealis]